MTGFININKAEGESSAKEVAKIKRLSGAPCGHMGTLDPMASGVLPIAIGNATRLFEYFLSKKKTYRAVFRFGIDTDTLDTTGLILSEGGYIPTLKEVENAAKNFVGEISQIPPMYSAKSIDGRRGYALAREGKIFDLPAKNINIYSIFCLGEVAKDSFLFDIECGAGTYIRSLARDMGKALNTTAVMSSLVRVKSGPFDIKNSVKCENLTPENFKNYIIPTDSVIDLDSITADKSDCKRLFNGLSCECGGADGLYKIYNFDGMFYGLAEIKDGVLKVRTKLC